MAKLRVELEKSAAALRDRVILGVAIPASQHRAMIGRGGQNLIVSSPPFFSLAHPDNTSKDLQGRTGTQVQFPGSRSYHQVGEPENTADLKDVEPKDIVKVLGPRSAAEKAVIELTKQIRAPAPDAIKGTVEVPLRYHHIISQQGSFFRNLRTLGVNVEQSASPTKSAVPARPSTQSTTRIDDAETDLGGVQWQVIANYQDAEEGNSEWTLRAKDQATLDKAKKLIKDAIEHAERASHVGFLSLPDRSVFPRIVGSKGMHRFKFHRFDC